MLVCFVVLVKWWCAWSVISLLCSYLCQWISLAKILFWSLPYCKFQLASVTWFDRFLFLWFMISKLCWCITKFLSLVSFYAWSGVGYIVVIASVNDLIMTAMWYWILQCCKDSVVNLPNKVWFLDVITGKMICGDIYWSSYQLSFWLCWGAWPVGHVPSNQYCNAIKWWNLPRYQACDVGLRPF
jgi:hypothetical protein